jgi:hypothetical protein
VESFSTVYWARQCWPRPKWSGQVQSKRERTYLLGQHRLHPCLGLMLAQHLWVEPISTQFLLGRFWPS